MAFDKKKIPQELIDSFKDKSGAFFVGAGLSIGAGLPSWEGLLKELIEKANKVQWIDKNKIKEYKALLKDNSKFLFLAEDIKSELGNHFYDFIDERFNQRKYKPTPAHIELVRVPASIIITVNYDNLIELAWQEVYGEYPNPFIYSQAKEAANNFWKGRFFVLKAHGDAKRDVNTLILSQRDYRKTLYRETGYRSLLQAVFTTKSIVFIGVSMNDPEVNQLLDYLHDSYHGGGPTHYLIMDDSNRNNILAKRYREEFNIEVIYFSNPDKDFKELLQFLKAFNKMVSE